MRAFLVIAAIGAFGCGGRITDACDDAACAQIDASAPDVSVRDASLATDAPQSDVSPPPPPPPPPPTMCPTPADVSKFMPPAFVPPLQKKVCSGGQIMSMYAACFGPQQQPKLCQQFMMTNTECASCIETMRTDAAWGPLVATASAVYLNRAGCATLRGDKVCGAATEQEDACLAAACEMQCPISDPQSFMDYQKCLVTAQATGCKKYTFAQDSACKGSAAAAQCQVNNFADGFFNYAQLFCGM